MRPRRPPLTAEAVQPILALAQAQFAAGAPTLARAEVVVTELFRHLGPELIEGLLHGAAPTETPEKGGLRCVRAATPDTATEPARAR